MLLFGHILQAANPKKYKILRLFNCSSIKIGKKVLTEQSIFNDNEIIYWKSASDAMCVETTGNTNNKRILAAQGFAKYKASSLVDFLTKEKGLAARGDGNVATHYRKQDFYLVDTLHFKAYQKIDTTIVAEAVWSCNNKQVITRIQRTEDDNFYIITPEIFGEETPQDILLNIRERDKNYEYINNVYSGIHIICIPIKEK